MKNNIKKQKQKVIIFFGSPRLDGYTAKLLNLVKNKLEVYYDFTLIDSYKLNIKPCVDCRRCREINNCIYDDFGLIDYELKTADIIIIATPIYNLSVPAPLKSIFDRMQIYYNRRFIKKIISDFEKEKKAILIVTCGSKDLRGAEIVEEQIKLIFKVINAKLEKKIILSNTDSFINMEDLENKVNEIFDNTNIFET